MRAGPAAIPERHTHQGKGNMRELGAHPDGGGRRQGKQAPPGATRCVAPRTHLQNTAVRLSRRVERPWFQGIQGAKQHPRDHLLAPTAS